MVIVRILALIVLLTVQSFATAAHFHVEEVNQCHFKTDSCPNEDDLATGSQTDQQAHSDADECCHVHCCISFIPVERSFETFYSLMTDNESVFKTLLLNNYHNSVYRPPIA